MNPVPRGRSVYVGTRFYVPTAYFVPDLKSGVNEGCGPSRTRHVLNMLVFPPRPGERDVRGHRFVGVANLCLYDVEVLLLAADVKVDLVYLTFPYPKDLRLILPLSQTPRTPRWWRTKGRRSPESPRAHRTRVALDMPYDVLKYDLLLSESIPCRVSVSLRRGVGSDDPTKTV